MKVRVERCYRGGEGGVFRLSWKDGVFNFREYVAFREGEQWGRSFAKQALDLLEGVYGQDRRSIRFDEV